MTSHELESMEPELDFTDPSAMFIFLLMLLFAQFDNEIVMRDDTLYEKISDGHYRKIPITLDQIKSPFEEIFGKELEAESFCSATKNFIEKSDEIECSLNKMSDIIGKASEDTTSRPQ